MTDAVQDPLAGAAPAQNPAYRPAFETEDAAWYRRHLFDIEDILGPGNARSQTWHYGTRPELTV